jgi:hypothetical protein
MPCTPVVSDDQDAYCRVSEHSTAEYNRKLNEIKSEVSSPDFQMLVNRERLEAGQYIANTVLRESIIINQQFSINEPVFMDNFVHKDLVKDGNKVFYFNSGEPTQLDYFSMEFGGLESSSWVFYEPGKVKYRFLGFQLFLSPDMVETERMTYGLGQMLGETGGLFKMLDFFFNLIFGFISPIRLFPYLTAALYRDDSEEQSMIDKFLKKDQD